MEHGAINTEKEESKKNVPDQKSQKINNQKRFCCYASFSRFLTYFSKNYF